MSFIKSIFQKELGELSISDIENFFNDAQEETATLEFKSGRSSLEDIYGEISAFLNTEGGLLIIGAPEETATGKGKHERRTSQGKLTFSKISSQDTLMRCIASNISPAPHGIKCKQFITSEGSVFIVDVPQSLTPPHQVSNEGRYYIRLDREARSAPHGIVEALFFKRQKPNLQIEFGLRKAIENVEEIIMDFRISNDSDVTAEFVSHSIVMVGVSKINWQENMRREGTLKKNVYSYQDSMPESIFVRGISQSGEFGFLPLYENILITYSAYCKDHSVISKAVIYNIQKNDFVETYSSIRHDNTVSMPDLFELHNLLISKESKQVGTLKRNSQPACVQ